MTAITPSELRAAFERAKAEAAAIREARKELSGIAKGLPKGTDWPELRALAVAADADEHDEDKRDRVSKLLGKGAYATWYAEILRLKPQNEQNPRFVHKPALAVVPQSKPVTCPPMRQQTDGAAVSNRPADSSDTPTNSGRVQPLEMGGSCICEFSPDTDVCVHCGVTRTEWCPRTTAASNSEIEGAVLPGPHLNGRIEPLGNDGLDAPSSLPDDGDVRGSPFDRNRVEA